MKGRTVLCETAWVGLFLWVSACGNHPTAPSAIPNQSPPSPQPPHRTINGIVRAVNGSGLGDVTIRASKRTGGDSPVPVGSAAADGSFHLEQLAQDFFSFAKTGYELAGWSMPQNAKPDETFTIVVKMKPTLRLAEGGPVENVITADDLAYLHHRRKGNSIDLDWPGNVLCGPCKFIFVPAPPHKGGRLTLSSTAALTMWVADYYSGPIVVATGGADGHELVLDLPADQSWNMVLVGLNRRDGPALSAASITFRVALVDP